MQEPGDRELSYLVGKWPELKAYVQYVRKNQTIAIIKQESREEWNVFEIFTFPPSLNSKNL